MKRTLLLTVSTALVLSLASTGTLAKGEYYRWTGDDGVIHYGARPPEGVDAELITTWGKSAPESKGGSPEEKSSGEAETPAEQKKELAAARQQQCDDERTRLKALTTPGRRLRMEQPDGSVRYLTSDEVSQEISKSREFISQACN